LLTQPSYRLEEARKVALAEAAPAPMGGGGEHGAAIGKLVHYLLETALGRPGLNIEDEARRGNNALGTDLPADAVADCAGLAHSVLDSEPWRRALRAERRLAEPFFAAPLSPGDKTPGGVVRGRIDLAFGEPDGWVLVDYKTDRVTHGNVEEYETHYAPQLLLYAEAWRAATGEDVAEAGLYFVRPGIYRPIDLPATGEQGWLF
jgi:ATP-dependent helicase/nuclease subunit A